MPDDSSVNTGLTRRARRTLADTPPVTPATPSGITRAQRRQIETATQPAPVEAAPTRRQLRSSRARIASDAAVASSAVSEEPLRAAPEASPRVESPRVESPRVESPRADDPFRVAVPVAPDAPLESDADAQALSDDAFEAAIRAFSFTGENPIVAAPVVRSASTGRVEQPVRRRIPVKRLAAATFSIGVMGAVGLLTVATGAPAEAVAAATKTDATTSIQTSTDEATDAAAGEIQAYVAPADANAELHRDETYSTATLSDIASASGVTNQTNFFVNDPSSPIQWPFSVGVPITDGFGPRWGSFHHGLDFTPGAGAEIQSVAEGTVRTATEAGGVYGVHVIVDHEIDGEVFSTHYAHMEYGSLQVAQGDKVEAGTVLGHTGDTGLSYGAHLHFEVFVNEVRVDPLVWLRENAGG
ncbi:peptidoglycan DD-metalloendopeptidase family protein [Microbacterium sp. LRZ72]|uniref:peptidoglycan DD-metalloendopeptidase family protein n=1 Tax=Microbacterium sp. LRZ72 TaxID=2942481 RepID=UPI0029A7223E|nr:peptidoglycan DD-metalloendopeptidase family protein [Microbacterium sp. LRZ72]MDX2376780.1 peptidoglycan DD-metalloendopeptidase family protein [Microbacterium sp. LRZ72]